MITCYLSFFGGLLNLHVVMYGFPVKAITPTSFLDRNLKTYCNTLQMPWHRQRETASQSQYTIDRNNFNQLDEWSWWMIMMNDLTYSVILHNILYYTETFFFGYIMWIYVIYHCVILYHIDAGKWNISFHSPLCRIPKVPVGIIGFIPWWRVFHMGKGRWFTMEGQQKNWNKYGKNWQHI